MSGAGRLIIPVARLRPVLTLKNSGGKKDDLATTLLSAGAGRMLSRRKKALDRLIKEAARQDVAVTGWKQKRAATLTRCVQLWFLWWR